MQVSRDELIRIRIKLAKQMDKYIRDLGDEEIWEDWITLGIPDEPLEDDFEFFAKDDNEWEDLCSLFGKLVEADAE